MIRRINAFLDSAAATATLALFISGASITSYMMYSELVESVKENQKQIELTQILILRPLVRIAENNPCFVSDAEWDEYITNGSTLVDLKKKHKLLANNIGFTPIKRVTKTEESSKCRAK